MIKRTIYIEEAEERDDEENKEKRMIDGDNEDP
jgi:hypothetical protein